MAGSIDGKGGRPEGSKGRVRAFLYLGVAAAAAVGAAVLLTRYMDTQVAAVRIPTVKVVVATADLSIATTLRKDQVAVVDWPAASVPDGTVTNTAGVEGKVVQVAVSRGEPILLSKLAGAEGGNGGLSTVLPPGMRAMAVHVDDSIGVAGFIHPGDHVDVIVTMNPESQSSAPASKVILQNLKVLAIGKELETRKREPNSAPIQATVATLMVDGPQSEKLALAVIKGQILLTLRSSVDRELTATPGVSPHALLYGAPPAPKPEVVVVERPARHRGRQKVAQAPAPAPAPAPVMKTVEIMRGDLFEKRDFRKDDNQ